MFKLNKWTDKIKNTNFSFFFHSFVHSFKQSSNFQNETNVYIKTSKTNSFFFAIVEMRICAKNFGEFLYLIFVFVVTNTRLIYFFSNIFWLECVVFYSLRVSFVCIHLLLSFKKLVMVCLHKKNKKQKTQRVKTSQLSSYI